LESIVVLNAKFGIYLFQHFLEEFTMSFNLAILPVSLWIIAGAVNAESLRKLAELFTTEFRTRINNQMGRGSRPA
jgi:hypothetical protein